MLLIVDIGNSYTKFKILNTSYFFSKETLSYDHIDDLKKDFLYPEGYSITDAIISSVRTGKEVIIRDFIKDMFNVDALIVSKEMKMINYYPTINNELGSDLIALMEGASLYTNTHITITLGTATVINLVINKKYVGTIISPGIFSSMKGLIDSTSLLKTVDLYEDVKLLGINTSEALNSGIVNGFKYLIDGFIDDIKNKYELDNVCVFITGGFSKAMSKKLKNDTIYNENIIFEGLSNLYTLNKK